MKHLLLFRLARLLYAPAGHGRIYRLAHHPPPMPSLPSRLKPLLEFVTLFFICGAMLTPGILLLAAGGAILLIFNGTFFGAWWANQMAALLTDLRGRGNYDLFAVQPGGRLGLHLAICTGVLHRLESLSNLYRFVRAAAVIAAGFTLFSLCMIGINTEGWRSTGSLQTAMQTSLDTSLGLLTFLLIFYLDHLASIVLCALCGMLIPAWASRGAEARLGAVGLFLSVQVVSYAAWGLIGLVLLPALLPAGPGGLGRLPMFALQAGSFLLIREAGIQLLWRSLAFHLEFAPNEVHDFAGATF
jgi:hypothetical protein